MEGIRHLTGGSWFLVPGRRRPFVRTGVRPAVPSSRPASVRRPRVPCPVVSSSMLRLPVILIVAVASAAGFVGAQQAPRLLPLEGNLSPVHDPVLIKDKQT